MAMSKALIASVFLSLLLLQFVQAIEANDQMASNSDLGRPIGKTIDCGRACNARCQMSKRPNLCKRACGTCCDRCNCVPKGTSGNFESCACYANLTTRGNQRKCP